MFVYGIIVFFYYRIAEMSWNRTRRGTETQRGNQRVQQNVSWADFKLYSYSWVWTINTYNSAHDRERDIVYVIESAAYGVLFTSCLCQKPERARFERVRGFDTNNNNNNNEWIKPCTKHFLCHELFITQNKIIFIELAVWTQIRNKNSLTIEPNANLI